MDAHQNPFFLTLPKPLFVCGKGRVQCQKMLAHALRGLQHQDDVGRHATCVPSKEEHVRDMLSVQEHP